MYFGAYQHPKDAGVVGRLTASSSRDVDRVGHQNGAPKGRRFGESTEHARMRHVDERLEADAAEMKNDIAEVRELNDVHRHLTEKCKNTENLLDQMNKKHAKLEATVEATQKAYEAERRTTQQLEQNIQDLETELTKAKGLMVLEKERYSRLLTSSAEIEAQMKQQLAEAKAEFALREQELKDEVAELQGELRKAVAAVAELEQVKEENRQRRLETQRMKQSLTAAKAYTLHKALNATVSASKEQSAKLHRIIAHLQAEQHKTNQMAETLTAERNVLKEELSKAEAKHQQLLQQMSNGSPSPAANGDSGQNPSPLALLARKYAATGSGGEDVAGGGGEDNVIGSMKATIAELRQKLNSEKGSVAMLKENITEERASHEAAETALREKLMKERDALLRYAQHLEAQIQG